MNKYFIMHIRKNIFCKPQISNPKFQISFSIAFAFCFACQLLFAQQSKQEKKDTITYHSVLIIPYDPHYYLSDADRDIAAVSKTNPEAFRKIFRTEADRNVYRAFARETSCISMLQDTSQELFEDVANVMSKIGFAYDAPTIKEKVSLRDRIIKTDPNKDAYDSRTSAQYLNDKTELRYMKAVISKPELLNELAAKYHFDLFVFVTQMEIKTNYASCIDIANKIYKREVMLHFTIYDSTGKLIAGNFAKTFFPSNENNANKIIGQCFPQLAEGILESVAH
ncbi:MAG: hypothetical protein ABI723_05360 [Bacteroidia bacterium]